MVNTENFINRLEKILDFYSLSASGFADKIGVQRSSLSHLLSGRNKPSLDFVLKIIEFFPEVDLYWILIGKGVFPKLDEDEKVVVLKNIPITTSLFENNSSLDLFSQSENSETEISKTNNSNFENEEILKPEIPKNNNNSKIERIVTFYIDGTFEAHLPR